VAKTTVTDATGAAATVEEVTVRVALPLADPRVAIMSATPEDFAVTSPEAETVATEVLLELQATGWFTRRFRRSSKSAVACVVWPISSGLCASVTVADATTDASPVESFSARPARSEVALSEHDKVMQKAIAVVSMPGSLRFMIIPMNRATSFSRAPNCFYACSPRGAGI
jgi:hypothetical protein